MDFFSKLPLEIWSQILSDTGLNDRIRNREVSRLFKQCCEQAKQEQLNVYIGKTRVEFKENDVSLDKFLFIKKNFKFGHQLKKLELVMIDPKLAQEFDFGLLNDLSQLNFLRIQGNLPQDGTVRTLSLPALETLYIGEYGHGVYLFKVDAPKLRLLSVGDLNNMTLVHPESVREVLCDECDHSTLIKFKNLEILQCCIYLELKDDLLSQLVHLKEFHIDFPFLSYFTEETFDTLTTSLKELLRQREALKRSDLLITWRNVKLLNAEQLDVSLQFMKNLFNFPMKNYRFLLDKFRFSYHLLPDRIFLNYNFLVDGLAGGEIRDDFHKKFRFSCVQVFSKVADPEHFLRFLKSVPKLTGLNLIDSDLSQSFLERLADELTDIREFYFNDERTELDLRFIMKFKELECFKTNLDTEHNQHELLYEAGERLSKLQLFTVGGLTTRFISS